MEDIVSLMKEKQEVVKVKKLQEENQKLQKEIDKVLNELVSLQTANGVQQITVPGAENTIKDPKSKVDTFQDIKVCVQVLNEDTTSCDKTSAKPIESKPPKTTKPKKVAVPVEEEAPIDVGRLDIRVGHITSAKIHPDADQLYLEQIDVGDENPRTVVSGLVKHVPLADLDKRMVLVLCNLKPQKMRGIFSEAMVLCASTPEKVELLCPPPGAKAGDKVTVPGYQHNPDLPFMNPKKKIFEKVAEDLKVDSQKRASYKGVPWEIEGKQGLITAQTLTDCHIK